MTELDETLRYPIPRDPRCPLDPPGVYERMQKADGLTRVRIRDGSEPWLVTRFDDVVQAMGDARLSGDHRLPGFPLASASSAARLEGTLPYAFREDDMHRAQRAMLMREFTPKKMEELRPRVQRFADDAIDAMLAGPRPVDLVSAFALPFAIHVICELLGVDGDEEREHLHGLCRAMGSRTTPPEEASRANAALQEYFQGLVEAGLDGSGKSLVVDLLAERIRAGELTRDDAAGTIQMIFHAGHGPTAYMIAVGTVALFAHPEQLAAFRDLDDVAPAVVELLRYTTVSQAAMPRAATEDVELGGTVIRAGEGVLLQMDAADRDPSAFPEPDRLDLSRPPTRNVALGHGLHQCLGRALTYVELQVAFGTLFRRIPGLRPAIPLEEMPFKDNEHLVGLYNLPVTW
ncbi:cytochrome P450 [Streptomyces sp. NPDC048297]|uniref:cytochrome P450 n=1 Tax=Streptomyces sp. NPDC048297 TaxID=3365531 RepID=UPI0037196BE2